MKKQHGFLYLGIFLLIAFIAGSIFTFIKSKGLIEQGYLASEGSAAENFAVLAAANISLTDAEVDALKQMSYAELQSSDENEALRRMMDNHSFAQKVDYAYIMLHLKEEEVRYFVTEDLTDRFEAPVGTALDIMWLLDVNVSETGKEQAAGDELSRYSYYIEEDAVIFGEAPTYLYNQSEWGDHICGYAPIYTVEGRYIGVIGVELQMSDYYTYCKQAVFAMGILMLVSLAMLSLLFGYLYLRYRRLQFDKIYVDALVQIHNRSYYNNQMVKYLNAHRTGGQFALMIADVDWFKKVNDTFGHEVGDEVLIEIGEILVSTFGRERVVRFGGEEFVVALWFETAADLKQKLETLFAQMAGRRFSSRGITLSLSLGCSYCEAKELNGWLMSDMLRAADCKLYEAKESGRNCYLLDPFDQTKTYRKTAKASPPKDADGEQNQP